MRIDTDSRSGWARVAQIYPINYYRQDKVPACACGQSLALYAHGERSICWHCALKIYNMIVRLVGEL